MIQLELFPFVHVYTTDKNNFNVDDLYLPTV